MQVTRLDLWGHAAYGKRISRQDFTTTLALHEQAYHSTIQPHFNYSDHVPTRFYDYNPSLSFHHLSGCHYYLLKHLSCETCFPCGLLFHDFDLYCTVCTRTICFHGCYLDNLRYQGVWDCHGVLLVFSRFPTYVHVRDDFHLITDLTPPFLRMKDKIQASSCRAVPSSTRYRVADITYTPTYIVYTK